jgi:hypothetical protein
MIAAYWLERLQEFNVAVLLVACVTGAATIIAATALIASAWKRVRQTDTRSALVGMMLQRGMSAADIERVMTACCGQDAGTDGDPEAYIIGLMKENQYSGDDVERVLDAARKNGSIDAAAVKIIESLVEEGVEGREIETLLDARSPRAPQPV